MLLHPSDSKLSVKNFSNNFVGGVIFEELLLRFTYVTRNVCIFDKISRYYMAKLDEILKIFMISKVFNRQ